MKTKEYETGPLIKVGGVGLAFLLFLNILFYNKIHYSSPPDQLHYTQSALLYFKNVRAYYYDMKTDTVSYFEIYSFRRLKKALKSNEIGANLIINPRADMAYLYPDFKNFNNSFSSASYVVENDTLILFPSDGIQLKSVFIRLRDGLLQDKKILLLIDKEIVCNEVYSGDKCKKAMIQLIEDYLKLTSLK